MEISTQRFLKPDSSDGRAGIEARLARIAEYEQQWKKVLLMFRNLGTALKAELERRGCTPLEAKNVADATVQGAQMEITLALAHCNVAHAEALTRQFDLLRTNYGRWQMVDERVIMEDGEATRQWNEASMALIGVAEERQTLERKLLKSPAPEK